MSLSTQNTEPSLNSSKSLVHVAVAVIERQGKTFVAKRADHLHQGGLWEFPGGKVEPGEDVLSALARELKEELGISLNKDDLSKAKPLITIEHDYGDKCVLLDVWSVSSFQGDPIGNEGQSVQWADQETLAKLNFPKANEPILTACSLPDLIAITPAFTDLSSLESFCLSVIQKGAGKVLVRQPGLEPSIYCEWARYLNELLPEGKLILHGDPKDFCDLGAVQVHMPARIGLSYKTLPSEWSCEVSMSCHNLDEIEHAKRLGVKFAFLSAVKTTSSHPGREPLGWSKFKDIVRQASFPVFALGGLSFSELCIAKESGAQGLAAISAWLDQ